MTHPLDHALIVTRIQPTQRTFKQGVSPRMLNTSSGGAYAPLLLALDPRFRPKQVVLIYDRADQEYARYIDLFYNSLGIAIEHWPQNLALIEESIANLSKSLAGFKKPLALCVNSDQPCLSQLASSVFQQMNAPILSCINGSLYRLGLRPQKINLEPKFELASLLSHLGARVQQEHLASVFEPHLQSLSTFLTKTAHNLAQVLTVIQRLAKESDPHKLLSAVVKGSEIAIPLFQETLERFEAAGCVELNQGRLLFSSQQDRGFCSGGWLSMYIQSALKSLAPKHRVWALSQEVNIELAYPSPLDRQIDLIAFIDSQLFFFFYLSSSYGEFEQLIEDQVLLVERFGAQIVFLSLDELSLERQMQLNQEKIMLCQGEELLKFETWLGDLL